MKKVERSLQVQRNQLTDLEFQEAALKKALEDVEGKTQFHQKLISESEEMLSELNEMLQSIDLQDLDLEVVEKSLEQWDTKENVTTESTTLRELTSTPIHAKHSIDYERSIEAYIREHKLILSKEPFDDLMSQTQKKQILETVKKDYGYEGATCDQYDYIFATFSGLVSGLVDVFFVGSPTDSILQKWTDKKVDETVIRFSKFIFNKDKKNGKQVKKAPDNIASAIGYLERRYKVNYDARYAKDLVMGDKVLNMSAKNHHLKSLGHSPDIIGLFFSILDQFTGKASFVSEGKILRLVPKDNSFELKGDTLVAKVIAGFFNWLGHLMSDIAGSSGTRGHINKSNGAGIPIPFYNLLQLCNFGSFDVNGDKKTLAELSVKVFEEGYDFRAGLTMAIPVAINELMIRVYFAFKSYFYHKKSFKESLPIGKNLNLQRMLIVGHGVLCLTDGVDAALRSKGQALLFATRLNLVAWVRLGFLGFKEAKSLYIQKMNELDLKKFDQDLEIEWTRIQKQIEES